MLGRAPVWFVTIAMACLAQEMARFEVVSIKPSAPDGSFTSGGYPGGRVVARGTLKMLLTWAYRVRSDQIRGGPGWISNDVYAIEAKAPGEPSDFDTGDAEPYLRTLLEERFGLRIHRETRPTDVYALVVARGGPKMPASKVPVEQGRFQFPVGGLDSTSIAPAEIARFVQIELATTVTDETGLKGRYEVHLRWRPQRFLNDAEAEAFGVSPSAPTVFDAVTEQLGLRLERRKGSETVLVIDSVNRPSEN